jgi:REP element-mobilizing transposase RayT
MKDLFKQKYRISSARLQHWNYGWAGAYFITICTQNRRHFFGEIQDETMMLSAIGEMVQNEWLITPNLRPDMHLALGEFVVMPDHFHCILVIGDNDRDAMHCVSIQSPPPSPQSPPSPSPTNQFGPQRKNVASVIRGFKSAVTKNARIICPDFSWQPRFYDHIIRDDQSFSNISQYILNNPKNWGQKGKVKEMPMK